MCSIISCCVPYSVNARKPLGVQLPELLSASVAVTNDSIFMLVASKGKIPNVIGSAVDNVGGGAAFTQNPVMASSGKIYRLH